MIPVAKRLIGAIKAGQSFLGWDDATYRGVLCRLTGKRSSTKCSIRELEDVKEYMHSQGFPRKAPKGKGRRPNVANRRKALLSKIEALLAEGGLSWAYAEGIASHMYKQHVIEWLDDDQLHGVMVALIKQSRRKGRSG
ncbi:gp16 family protein [Salmonella enterica]|uniref:Regulatory protein GemA n=1 Tax=Salmonella enterica TaxID=28901 RepID=A0A639YPR2_SALER|nr:regulatory protein GemA [Salmonella enterica]EEE3015173.1 regulatory protein GemA [Salmonella enterica subsp. enterica serovar Pensacola]EEI8241868.1 regulatory protein GemA [Salmonella enterica subsp. enterica serovar 4,[5],12:i:-]ECJ8609069.1 regulatory protein GemA [Salmonella enterica]ECL4900653.1 regulatory protein GemA [Salmonella enterica]